MMQRKIKSRLVKFLNSKKIKIFFIFLVVSTGILFISKLSKTYTYTTLINVNPIQLPEHRILVGDSTKTLSVTLKGVGFRLAMLYFNKPELTANLKNAVVDTVGKSYTWSTRYAKAQLIDEFDANIEIMAVQPEAFSFNYDQFFKKLLTVKLNSSISYDRGYDSFSEPNITPNQVVAIGSETILSTLDTIETEPFNFANLNQSIKKTLALKSLNRELYRITPKEIEVKIKVEKFTEGDIELPVQLINVPDTVSVTYFPKTVVASFYTSLSRFNQIQANQFQVTADFKSLKPNASILTLELTKQPDSIKRVQLKQKQIEFILN